MVNTATTESAQDTITREELLKYWQGHRRLTRRAFEAFPEKAFFNHSIGGMRTPAQLLQELLAIDSPGLRQLATGEQSAFEEIPLETITKAQLLELWDKASDEITRYWGLLPDDAFHQEVNLFGMYKGTGWSSIFYFIDNQIHHRGQSYVYLRSLGIEPPFFWES